MLYNKLDKNTVNMDKNTVILKRAYYAFNTRNIDAALAVMHPNVIWSNGMEGGYVHGHDGVREYWNKQWQVVDRDIEPISIAADGNGKIVANVHQVVRDMHENIIEDGMVQHVYLIEDNLIKHMDITRLPLAV